MQEREPARAVDHLEAGALVRAQSRHARLVTRRARRLGAARLHDVAHFHLRDQHDGRARRAARHLRAASRSLQRQRTQPRDQPGAAVRRLDERVVEAAAPIVDSIEFHAR